MCEPAKVKPRLKSPGMLEMEHRLSAEESNWHQVEPAHEKSHIVVLQLPWPQVRRCPSLLEPRQYHYRLWILDSTVSELNISLLGYSVVM